METQERYHEKIEEVEEGEDATFLYHTQYASLDTVLF
jgi:hypothetical protein